MRNEDTTEFLNVDLELVATIELAPLVEHLANATLTLRDSVDDGRRMVWMELDRQPRDVDEAILGFARLIQSLPADLRKIWDGCEDRCLNVGIQGGRAPHARAFPISSTAIANLAAMGARLEVTVYAAEGHKPEGGS